MTSLYRPASSPTLTTANPPTIDIWQHHPLTPTTSLPSPVVRDSPPFPQVSPPLPHPPLSAHSPLSRPPFLPAPSSPSLNIANEVHSGISPRDELKARNIVILLDGTGNQVSRTNSNVIKTLSVLEADETQLLYYSSGVGTILPDHASTWGSLRTAVAGGLDKALAWRVTQIAPSFSTLLVEIKRGE